MEQFLKSGNLIGNRKKQGKVGIGAELEWMSTVVWGLQFSVIVFQKPTHPFSETGL